MNAGKWFEANGGKQRNPVVLGELLYNYSLVNKDRH